MQQSSWLLRLCGMSTREDIELYGGWIWFDQSYTHRTYDDDDDGDDCGDDDDDDDDGCIIIIISLTVGTNSMGVTSESLDDANRHCMSSQANSFPSRCPPRWRKQRGQAEASWSGAPSQKNRPLKP